MRTTTVVSVYPAVAKRSVRDALHMPPFELSPAQLAHYGSQGYVLLDQWLSPSLVSTLQAEVEAGLSEQFTGTDPHSQWMWSRASAVPASITPTLAKAQELPEFLTPARQLLGEDLVGLGVDMNRYIGDVGWHPDGRGPGPDWGLDAAKFMVYLDPVSASTGSLHIVPGTHRLDGEARDTFAAGIAPSAIPDTGAPEFPGAALETKPGDLIIFNIHGKQRAVSNRTRPCCRLVCRASCLDGSSGAQSSLRREIPAALLTARVRGHVGACGQRGTARSAAERIGASSTWTSSLALGTKRSARQCWRWGRATRSAEISQCCGAGRGTIAKSGYPTLKGRRCGRGGSDNCGSSGLTRMASGILMACTWSKATV